MSLVKELPEEIEQYRDRKWRREDALKVDTAERSRRWSRTSVSVLASPMFGKTFRRFISLSAADATRICRGTFRKIRGKSRVGVEGRGRSARASVYYANS